MSELEAEQQAQLARVDKLQGEQQALAAQFVETKAKNTLKMAQLQAQLQAQLRDEEEAGKKALEQITRKQSSLFEMIQADKATAAKLAAKIKQLNKNQEAEKMARAAGDAKAKEHADAAVEEAAAKQSATDADVQELDRQMMRATTRLKGAANKLESKVAAQGKVLKETVQAVSNLKDDDNDSLFDYSEDGDGEARDVDLSDLEVPTTPAASSGPPPEVPDTKELRRKGLLDVTNKDCVGA